MEANIVDFPEARAALLEHPGSPALEHASVKKLIARRIKKKSFPENHQSYAIHYNNSATTTPDEYRVDLCVSLKRNPPNPQGVINKAIPAGRCAVARHVGSRDNVTAVTFLNEKWLSASGRNFAISLYSSTT
jgi:AraC family transcriptional regulator